MCLLCLDPFVHADTMRQTIWPCLFPQLLELAAYAVTSRHTTAQQA